MESGRYGFDRANSVTGYALDWCGGVVWFRFVWDFGGFACGTRGVCYNVFVIEVDRGEPWEYSFGGHLLECGYGAWLTARC